MFFPLFLSLFFVVMVVFFAFFPIRSSWFARHERKPLHHDNFIFSPPARPSSNDIDTVYDDPEL
ncbi:MAG: hypothetical protein LBG88_03800 [Christensenellaceae bacterium]|jgi:hypothetical protein|nr:hypothetical protein [Christensenellaceae bacterium]